MTSLQENEIRAASTDGLREEQASPEHKPDDVAEEDLSEVGLPRGRQAAAQPGSAGVTSSTVGEGVSAPVPSAADDASATDNIMETLRRYHLGDPGAAKQTEKVADGFLPALLNPYRDVSRIRYEYPLYLVPPQSAEGVDLARPVGDFLREMVEGCAPGAEAARILKDNLPWIERYVREKLAQGQTPVDAVTLLSEGGQALQDHLALDETNRERLQGDLENLIGAVGPGGKCLGYGPYVAIQLLAHAVEHRVHRLRREFAGEIEEHIRALRTLLGIERSKTAVANEPEMVRTSVGSAATYFDAAALSGMLEQHSRGSIPMSAERKQRISAALEILEAYREERVLVRFAGDLDGTWCEDATAFEIIGSDDPCATATEIYDRETARLAKVFGAVRIARLEIAGSYDPAVHDSWFANFDWQAFSPQEVRLVTTVVALESAQRIAGEGLRSCSQLLVSGKPVQILAWVNAYDNPGAGSDADAFQSFRFELAYFGIGHRQVVVAQSSAARHEALLSGFVSGLDACRTSLYLIDPGYPATGEQSVLDPWIVASAALESRAHPFIKVNPAAGENVAERVDFSGNPQPENDWPVNSVAYQDEQDQIVETELAFTFVDYALLIPKLQEHFRVVPAGCACDDLVAVDAYLALPTGEVDRCLPFVWATDANGVTHRLVVSRALMLAARDRRNYWRTLQELGGVRNRYVELAIEKVRAEEQAAAAAERERLCSAHNEELERVRTQAAGEVMGQLVDVLLGSDLSSLAAGGRASAAPSSGSPPAVAVGEPAALEQPAPQPQAPPPVEEQEEEVSFSDPWIESILCTSCDDCMSVNKLLFAYNENKQAVIRDPKAGTFAELVESAELCPGRCIHPGKPLNPNEPGLDELIKRAEPFN